MKAKVFKIRDKLESELNQWLENLPEGEVVDDTCIGDGIVLIFYGPLGATKRRRKVASTGPVICRQCRKRLSVEGMKSCAECLEYQRKYREDKKKEKDEQVYLP